MLIYYQPHDITCYVRRCVFSVRVTLQWWDDIDVVASSALSLDVITHHRAPSILSLVSKPDVGWYSSQAKRYFLAVSTFENYCQHQNANAKENNNDLDYNH